MRNSFQTKDEVELNSNTNPQTNKKQKAMLQSMTQYEPEGVWPQNDFKLVPSHEQQVLKCDTSIHF